MKTKITFLLCILALNAAESFSQCAAPVVYSEYAVSSTSERLNFACCTGGTYYVEYGLQGFTPGTGATPGIGGIMVQANTGFNFMLTGLTGGTYYDYYVRKLCAGNVWSPNSTIESFLTFADCSPVISCNTMVNVTIPAIVYPYEEENPWTCSSGYGREVIYSFTPTVSGMHSLFAASVSGNDVAYFSYKAASGGCNVSGWTCIGNAWGYGSPPSQLTFGPLNAGTQYFILVDHQSYSIPVSLSFRIECPYCAQLTNITTSNLTPNSIRINCTGAYNPDLVEYGPHGFVPGTIGSPGPGGTLVFFQSGGYADISGLSSNTQYDFYTRNYCSFGFMSPNSPVQSFTMPSCPQTFNYTVLGTPQGLTFSGRGYYDYYYQWGCYDMYGQEKIIKFTPPSTGYYTVKVDYYNLYTTQFNFVMKPSDGFCNVTGASCQSYSSSSSSSVTYNVGPLTANTSYDFIYDVYDSTAQNKYMTVTISCPLPTSVTASNIQPNSVNISWSCNCPSNTYIEYGPPGFTPGTTASAGTGGTVIANVSSPYSLTGLTTDTRYDIYLRSSCGGNFSANSAVLAMRTALDCSNAPVINCSDYTQITFLSAVSVPGGGAWTPGCNVSNTAKEGIWRFTPTQTGAYSLLVYNMTVSSTGYIYGSSYFIKEASLGCNELNWTCLGNFSYTYFSFTPMTVSLGTLTAGTNYLIRIDGVQHPNHSHTYRFRIDCPDVCSYPLLTGATVTSATSANISAACATCFGNNITLEYGPVGFTPGTDSTAGPGGTVVNGISSFPATLTGLTTGTYNVYARRNCGAPSGFSANSNMVSFNLCNTAPSSVSVSPSALMCPGDSVTLTVVGGSLAVGGAFNWYSGSCGGVFVGTGASITVSPAVTTTYFVRAEAPCGNTGCQSTTITVNNLNATVTAAGSTNICAGGSVTLFAVTGTGWSYQWRLNGTNISGATTSSYSANAAGNYDCIVTNACSTSTSNIIPVTISGTCALGLFFNGSRVTINDNPSYTLGTGDFTIEAWIKAASSSVITQVIVSKRSTQSNGFLLFLYTGKISLQMAGSNFISNSNDLRDNTCHHVAATRAGSTVKLYVDGTLVSTHTVSALNINSTHTLWLGQDQPAPSPYNGIVHEVRFWNSERTQSEIIASKDILLTGIETGLIGNWRMNEGSGQTVSDYSQINNSGVLGSTSSAEGIDPIYVSGCMIVACPPPSAVITPAGPTIFCTSGSVTLNANIGPGLNYQWQLNSSPILGATSSSYVASAGGNYDCLVSNSCGSATSNIITVTVNTAPIAVITPAGPTAFCFPGSVTLNANTGPGLSYQWRVNGVDITGEILFSYTTVTAGNFDCVVTNSCGSTISNTITVTEDVLPQALATAAGPTTFCSPGSVTLNVTTCTGCTYQWRQNTANILSANASSYTAVTAGDYDCLVTNTCGTRTSNTITVTTEVASVASITAAGPTTFCSPGSVTLNANIGAGLSYQWRLNGGTISGATSSSYNAAAAGNYDCVVSNTCGSITSNVIAVTVNPLPTAVITAAGPTTVCSPNSVTLNANTGPGLSYQWRLNSGNITGATASSYAATSSGNYDCIVTNSCGSITSNVISVTVAAVPAIPGSITGQATGVCSSTRTYSISAVSGATGYTWTVPAGASISSGQGTVSVNVTFTNSFGSGNVSVAATNICGSSGASSLSISGAPAQPGTINGPTSVCHNQNNVIYNIAAVTGATSYTWTVPPGAQIKNGQGTIQIRVRFGNSAGNITVRANNSCGQSPIRTLAIAMPCREGEEITEEDFEVTLYPNPATDKLYVIGYPLSGKTEIKIVDLLGHHMFTSPLTPLSSWRGEERGEAIDISALPSGIYFAEIISGEYKKVLKFIKQE